MNIAVFPPTDQQMAAYRRRQAFRSKIAEKAAALRQRNEAAAALEPECHPAEPDPPALCPECVALRIVLAKMKRRDALLDAPIGSAYPQMRTIQEIAARYWNVDRADIVSARRTAKVVRPRQVAMYLAKELTPFSLPQIGRHFGGRDHTTVLHAVRKIAALVFADAQFALEVVSLRMMLETGEAG